MTVGTDLILLLVTIRMGLHWRVGAAWPGWKVSVSVLIESYQQDENYYA